MGASIPDDEYEKYAPKRFREQPRMPPAEPLREQPRMPSAEPLRVTPAPVAPLSTDTYVERRTGIEFDPRSERIPEPPPRSDDRSSSLFVRFAPLFFFTAVLGLGIIFYKPVAQGVSALFELAQPSKPSDRATADALTNGRSDRLSANTLPAATSVARPAPALVPAPVPQQVIESVARPITS